MRMRLLAAAAVLASGAIHLKLWFDGFRYFDVVGPSFLLNAAGGLVIAVLLVAWRNWVPPLLAAGFGASTLGAFTISATVGLFGVHESWSSAVVLWAAAVEVVAILAGLGALFQERPVLPVLPGRWGGRLRAESGDREQRPARSGEPASVPVVRNPGSPDGPTPER
jgi:hypothetical protein